MAIFVLNKKEVRDLSNFIEIALDFSDSIFEDTDLKIEDIEKFKSFLDKNRQNFTIVPSNVFEEMNKELEWLQALEDAGVDNWSNIDYAKELYQDRTEELEDKNDF